MQRLTKRIPSHEQRRNNFFRRWYRLGTPAKSVGNALETWKENLPQRLKVCIETRRKAPPALLPAMEALRLGAIMGSQKRDGAEQKTMQKTVRPVQKTARPMLLLCIAPHYWGGGASSRLFRHTLIDAVPGQCRHRHGTFPAQRRERPSGWPAPSVPAFQGGERLSQAAEGRRCPETHCRAAPR